MGKKEQRKAPEDRIMFPNPLGHKEFDKVMVTPKLAKEWLERNVDNYRSMDDRVMSDYARQMQQGTWEFDGSPLRFDWRGVLVDGQKRVKAVAVSGIGQWFLVVTGLSKRSVGVMDTGAKRTLANHLTHQGMPAACVVANAVAWLATWRGGMMEDLEPGVSPRFRRGISTPEASLILADDPGILEVCRDTKNKTGYKMISAAGMVAFFRYVMGMINPTKAVEFWEGVRTGADLEDGSPILLLRQRILDARNGKTPLETWYKAALIIKAWTKFLDGKPGGQLMWRNRGPRLESFPFLADRRLGLAAQSGSEVA